MRVSVGKCLHHKMIFTSLLVMGAMSWGGSAHAKDAEASESSACKEEVLETGEKVCVRTRVISRRVVKRSSRPPTRRHKAKAPKTAPKTQRRSRFVVDPSAYEQSRAASSPARPSATTKQPVRTDRPATTAPKKAAPSATQLKVDASQGGVSSQVDRQEPVDPGEPRTSFRVEAVTDVPLLLGAGALLETKSRFRVRSSLGVMPQGYLKLSNRLLAGVDEDYPEEAQLLMEQAIDDTIAWRSQVGFRPFRRAGFYVHTGYTLLGVRGEATGEELVGAAEALDQEQGELMRRMNPDSVAMNSRLHMVDLELGWDFALGERANLRVGAGWAYTLHSKTTVVAEFDDSGQMPEEEVELFEEVSGKYLDAIYRTYVHPPSVSLAFGLRF